MQRWWLAGAVALVGAALVLIAGPGTRLGLWDYRTGFALLRWGAYAGLGGAVIALVALAAPAFTGGRPRGSAATGLLLAAIAGAVAAAVPWQFRERARSVPPIHDITTDTDTPPEFVAILPLRRGAPNSAEYGGPEVAAAQRAAYPDIQPLTLAMPPHEAFRRSLAAAREMGWDIVAADSAAGRIEATATTAWFGFKDDVVVRVQPANGGSRIDVRSVSRVGRSDVGTNAARIRRYLARLAD